MSFRDLKPGDKVRRMLSGVVPMDLTVESVTEDRILCLGGWEFHRDHGYEIDEDLGWGIPDEDGNIGTGSYLVSAPTTGADDG